MSKGLSSINKFFHYSDFSLPFHELIVDTKYND